MTDPATPPPAPSSPVPPQPTSRQPGTTPAAPPRDPALPEAFYLPEGTDTYRATGATQGPWDPGLQHGGPPAALLAHVVHEQTGRPGMRAARISVDFLGPVPVGRIETRVKVLRPGKRVQLVEAELVHEGRAVAIGRVWQHAVSGGLEGPVTVGDAVPPPLPPAPLPSALFSSVPLSSVKAASEAPSSEKRAPTGSVSRATSGAAASGPGGSGAPGGSSADAGGESSLALGGFGYGRALEWRMTSGSTEVPGPGAVWTRMRIPLVAGRVPTGLERMMTTADSANGISLELPVTGWLSMPTSLVVTALRHPLGEWVHMDARTHLVGDGVGLTEARLADGEGLLGTVSQPLFVARRE